MITTSLMTTEAIAKYLVEFCRESRWEDAQKALYSTDAVSVEPDIHPDRETRGLEAIIEKGRQWIANTQVHSMAVSEPLVADTAFALRFTMDVTCKLTGQRMKMSELAVYTVKNGQIVREEFFYDMCG